MNRQNGSRRNGSRRNGSRQNGSRQNGRRHNRNIPIHPLRLDIEQHGDFTIE